MGANDGINMRCVGPVFLVILLVAGSAGCSGYRIAAISGNSNIEEQPESDMPVLKEKMHARVHLVSGEVHEGEVVSVSDSEVVLGRAGNYGFERTSFPVAEIDKVEVESSSTAGSVITGTVGIVGLSLSALFVLFLLFGDVNGGYG